MVEVAAWEVWVASMAAVAWAACLAEWEVAAWVAFTVACLPVASADLAAGCPAEWAVSAAECLVGFRGMSRVWAAADFPVPVGSQVRADFPALAARAEPQAWGSVDFPEPEAMLVALPVVALVPNRLRMALPGAVPVGSLVLVALQALLLRQVD